MFTMDAEFSVGDYVRMTNPREVLTTLGFLNLLNKTNDQLLVMLGRYVSSAFPNDLKHLYKEDAIGVVTSVEKVGDVLNAGQILEVNFDKDQYNLLVANHVLTSRMFILVDKASRYNDRDIIKNLNASLGLGKKFNKNEVI